uniref:ZAD domain-containing protein n=1 Tax=Homalodisca liturata TaxID=320908 RepID=A0A1B6K5H5_9HEMI
MNFPSMCRLCLIPNQMNQTVEIFDDSNEIPEKILELTNIHVANGDGLPQEVCVVCREQLDRSITFKRQIQKAENMLRQHLTQHDSFIFCPSPAPIITGDPLSEEEEGKMAQETEKDELESEIKSEMETASPKWDSVTIKEEDSFVVAEPWPEELSNSDSFSAEDSVMNSEQNEKAVDIENMLKQIDSVEGTTKETSIKQENENIDASIETNEKGDKDECNQYSNEDRVDMKCFATIDCHCYLCKENKHKKKTVENLNESKITCELCGRNFWYSTGT